MHQNSLKTGTPFFSSNREQRPWIWMLVAIAAICSTLGLASVLAEVLYHQGLVTLAILATTLVGALDEGIQLFLPSRVFDPTDILFNLLAAVMAVTASAALRWARQLAQRLRS